MENIKDINNLKTRIELCLNELNYAINEQFYKKTMRMMLEYMEKTDINSNKSQVSNTIKNDLISRSALIEELDKRDYSREKHDFKMLIDRQLTAFDLDKVIDSVRISCYQMGFDESQTEIIIDEIRNGERKLL